MNSCFMIFILSFYDYNILCRLIEIPAYFVFTAFADSKFIIIIACFIMSFGIRW